MSKRRYTVVVHCRDTRHTIPSLKPKQKRRFMAWLGEAMRFPTFTLTHPNRDCLVPTSEVRYVEVTLDVAPEVAE